MAVTGKSWSNISASRRHEGGQPEILPFLESSSQTALRGAVVILTSGYCVEAGANVATNIVGVLDTAGQNGASNGAKTSRVLRARPGQQFEGSLNAVLTQAMCGSVANLSKDSSTWCIFTATSISTEAQLRIVGPAHGFAIGDTNPVVIFEFLDSKLLGYDEP